MPRSIARRPLQKDVANLAGVSRTTVSFVLNGVDNIAIPDETRGNVVKAFVVLAAGHAPSPALEADLAQHVRKHLAPYEYPKEIEFIDALPMTTTGKVQRKVLRERELARKRAANQGDAAPR